MDDLVTEKVKPTQRYANKTQLKLIINTTTSTRSFFFYFCVGVKVLGHLSSGFDLPVEFA